MNKSKLPELTAAIKIGRYDVESEEVGRLVATATKGSTQVQIDLNHEAMAAAVAICGPLDPSNAGPYTSKEVGAAIRAALSVSDGRSDVGTWLRDWLTRSLVFHRQIQNSSIQAFLRWAEERSRDFDMWLAVPAVREKIRSINNSGRPATKRRLAKIIAGIGDVRPIRAPSATVLYVKARDLEPVTNDIHRILSTSNNPAALWAELESTQPGPAAEFRSLGLDKLWFLSRPRPRLQGRTPWYMACEWIAAIHGLKATTVAKMAGRVRTQRQRQGRHPRQR
jgi:hypothetical protein